MRNRRFLSGLLILAMLLSWLDGLTLPTFAAENRKTVAPDITYAEDEKAVIKNVTLSQSAAWDLTIRGDITESATTYAVIMRYDLYEANYAGDKIGNVNSGTYSGLPLPANYYRSEGYTTGRSGSQLQLFKKNLYNFNSDADYTLSNSPNNINGRTPPSYRDKAEAQTRYNMHYVALVFDGNTYTADPSDYTIISFYIGNDGYLQTESYMIRYMANKYPEGDVTPQSIPNYSIENWGEDATLSKDPPTRTAFNFLGWDPKQDKLPATGNEAAAAVAAGTTADYPAGGTLPWKTVSESTGFAGASFDKATDRIYNLYAVWGPIPVRHKAQTTKATYNGQEISLLKMPANATPQVGKAYGYNVDLDASSCGQSTKSYEYVTTGTLVVDGETVTLENFYTRYQLSVAATGNTNKVFRFSGTPKNHSNEARVYTIIKVTDNFNKTTDLLAVTFDQIKKGAQPIPTVDGNTGLESRLHDGTEDVYDLFGFWSKGPAATDTVDDTKTGYFKKDPSDTSKNAMDGTGTMSAYYKKYGYRYEYRPKTWKGATVDYTSDEYKDLPDDGWREVPSSKTATESTTWPASYGTFAWDDDVPYVTGLVKDDLYEVRFKKSATYSESEAVEVKIGGGGGGGKAEPKDFAAIVFYDWDETYLGSAVIAKTATADDVQAAMNEFVKTKYSGYTDGMTFPADLANESWVDNGKMPLTYKKGYNFAGWVQVNSEGKPSLADAFTAYAELGEAGDDGSYPAGTFNAEKFTLGTAPEGGWSGFTLKAAYVENVHCNEGDGGYFYSSTSPEYKREGSAATANYIIRFTVSRRNGSDSGVTKLRDPAVRILMKAGNLQFTLLQRIKQYDVTEVEVVAPKNIDKAEIYVIDAYESWVSAGLNAEGKEEDQPKYVSGGTIEFINSVGMATAAQPDSTTLPASIDAATCADVGLTLNGSNITNRNIATVRKNLLSAYRASDGKKMTQTQIQHGINTGQWIPAE